MAGDDEGDWVPPDEPIEVSIEDSLDLHFFQPRDIPRMVDAYLDEALARGFREVRLIHGRGKGVQRARVQGMLDGDPRVEAWQEAPPGRGGWGATLVFLRASGEGGGEPE